MKMVAGMTQAKNKWHHQFIHMTWNQASAEYLFFSSRLVDCDQNFWREDQVLELRNSSIRLPILWPDASLSPSSAALNEPKIPVPGQTGLVPVCGSWPNLTPTQIFRPGLGIFFRCGRTISEWPERGFEALKTEVGSMTIPEKFQTKL